MGRLPEAWIAPPDLREVRELVRHRAKLVALRSHCKAEVHAVLAKCGVQVLMSDLFGLAGNDLLDRLQLPAPYAARIASLRRLLEDLEVEIDLFTGLTRRRLARDPGYVAVQQIPGIGPILGAVFVAEIGEVSRFTTAPQLACWAGLTPKHHESDTHVHRGRITKQGSRLVRWAAVESVKRVGPGTKVGALRDRVADRRGANIGAVAAARQQVEYVFYALRDHHVRALHPPTPGGGVRPACSVLVLWSVASRAGHDPHPAHPGWRGRAVLIDPTDRTGAPHHAARDDLSAGSRRRDDRAANRLLDRTHRR